MDNLDGFQKLVSTIEIYRDLSRFTKNLDNFSISIGLDCRDPQPYIFQKPDASLKFFMTFSG